MSDLRPEDRITSSKSDGLSELIAGKVQRWEDKRDVKYRTKWMEYKRMWMGEWASQDRDRQSERSRAIMPAIQQAVDSAVSEVEEAMFGQERWFDIASDDPSTEPDEGGPGRDVADRLLMDLRGIKASVSQCVLLGAVYGTGIGKLLIREDPDGIGITQELIPVLPTEFAIDPAAETIEEAEGVAHCFTIPYNVVLERQRQGIYRKIDPRQGLDPSEDNSPDENIVHIIEYQGLVPAKMLPDVSDKSGKLKYEDDKPIEAIVTIANSNVVLRAVENPLIRKDRGFIHFQWDTIPGEFFGRGIVQKAYWPQKVLDAEVRSRIDALAFSTHPMMAVNAAMVPRNADFTVRPGRNIFTNGAPSESLQPISFPPPDPQTYTQGQEMQRMIEMATGQLQAATPFGTNGRNETASGMSMMLGASIRRTRRTMANIERSFMQPLLRKAIDRFQQFDPRYTEGNFEFRVHGTLGMMAREFEQMQLSQLLNAIPPGPSQFALLRAVVDNMGITGKQGILQLLDLLTAQALEPPEPVRDLGGEARMLSAQIRGEEVQHQMRLEESKLQLEQLKIELQATTSEKTHQRDVMRLSVDAERAESEDVGRTAKAISDLAKAEAEEQGKQLDQLRQTVESMKTQQAATPTTAGGVDLSAIHAELEELREAMAKASEPQELSNDDISSIEIKRSADGLVESINGRAVQRDERGLIAGIQ